MFSGNLYETTRVNMDQNSQKH